MAQARALKKEKSSFCEQKEGKKTSFDNFNFEVLIFAILSHRLIDANLRQMYSRRRNV